MRLGLLPFHYGYTFPTKVFLNGLLFGLIICTASWMVTNLFRQWLFSDQRVTVKNTLWFLGTNLLTGTLVYCLLYIACFGIPTHIQNFGAYLFLSWSILVIENLIFLFYCTLEVNAGLVAGQAQKGLFLPVANGTTQVNFDDISYAYLRHGLVMVRLRNGKQIHTQCQGMSELESKLPPDQFYRVNRQYILHRGSIRHVMKSANRKLRIQIAVPEAEEISVSRYKKKDVLDWLE